MLACDYNVSIRVYEVLREKKTMDLTVLLTIVFFLFVPTFKVYIVRCIAVCILCMNCSMNHSSLSHHSITHRNFVLQFFFNCCYCFFFFSFSGALLAFKLFASSLSLKSVDVFPSFAAAAAVATAGFVVSRRLHCHCCHSKTQNWM